MQRLLPARADPTAASRSLGSSGAACAPAGRGKCVGVQCFWSQIHSRANSCAHSLRRISRPMDSQRPRLWAQTLRCYGRRCMRQTAPTGSREGPVGSQRRTPLARQLRLQLQPLSLGCACLRSPKGRSSRKWRRLNRKSSSSRRRRELPSHNRMHCRSCCRCGHRRGISKNDQDSGVDKVGGRAAHRSSCCPWAVGAPASGARKQTGPGACAADTGTGRTGRVHAPASSRLSRWPPGEPSFFYP